MLLIKLSTGSASVLGLNKIKMKHPPETAYLMLGEKCIKNCDFCAQAKESTSSSNKLSRITWNPYDLEQIIDGLNAAYSAGNICRACFQTVHEDKIFKNILSVVSKIKERSKIPICVALDTNNFNNVLKLINEGVDRICIPIDAATSWLFYNIKNSDFYKRLDILEQSADFYPGKISTHLIAGLGENEEDFAKILGWLFEKNIIPAIFAFTPVPGTKMEAFNQPDISSYRRIQIMRFFMHKSNVLLSDMEFLNGRLIRLFVPGQNWKDLIWESKGSAFRTSGCPGCNRPYYNEKPNGIMYNYPGPLSDDEIETAICESRLK